MIKKKNVFLQIILVFLTFGIYGIIWQVKLTNDMVTASKGKYYSTGGILALLLTCVTFGIYGIYWLYKMGQSAGYIRNGSSNDGLIYLILSFFGFSFIAMILAQLELNKVATA